MSLDDLRKNIDRIDDKILDLLEQRAWVAREIAEFKKDHGLAQADPARERALLERLEHAFDGRPNALFPSSAIRSVFREILSACLSLAEPTSVAYMGPPGSFTQMAARSAFGLGARYVETVTIPGVIDAVARRTVDYGVAPIENSTEGGVTATLDGLLETDVKIQREFVIEVTQCLMGLQTDRSQIRRVYSHPQALAQCRLWLARHLPSAELVVSSSTAAAAREAAVDETSAAIGSRLAAELSNLQVIQEGVQDRAENATRFVVLAAEDSPPTGKDKTSLAFSTAHTRGALRRALELFDDEGLNLTRIESRPGPGRRWEYVFFTDVEGHRTDPALSRALTRLQSSCSTVRVLGSYPRSDTP